MSCENTDELRIITKYSSFPGETPTIPISGDHNDGTWLPTDLYVGEMFINVADNKAWVRGMDGIFQIGATGGSFSFTGDYVYKSTGGTYSGDVYAPTFSSIGVVTQNIEANLITATYFVGGSFIGDGSGLTGINANWLGGSVSNPSSFSSNLGLYGPVVIDGTITSTDNIVDICSDVNIGCGYGVSASYFIGDGSQLTNLPIGTYSNFYTISATLSGNEIQFNRNDLAPAYSVDLTPLLSTYSVSSLTFDGITNELTLTYDNGNYFSALIDSFQTLSVINDINADTIYANNFYGVFNGTYSNDIYTTSANLYGTDAVFQRTDGSTYSLDLSTLSGGGSGSVGPTGPAGATGATGSNGSTPYMFISYNSTGLTLATGSVTLPVTTTLYIGWSQGTRVRIWNDATHYMEGQITTAMTYPQVAGNDIIVDVDYVVGTGTFGVWRVGIAGDIGSSGSGASASQNLSQVLTNGNWSGSKSMYIEGNQFLSNITIGGTGSGDLGNQRIRFGWDTSLDKLQLETGGATGWGYNGQSYRFNMSNTLSRWSYSNNGQLTDQAWIEIPDTGVINMSSWDTINSQAGSTIQLTNLAGGFGNSSYILMDDYQARIGLSIQNSGSDFSLLDVKPLSIEASGYAGSFQGIQYLADYSANYTSRSLVDKAYVDSVAGGSGITYSGQADYLTFFDTNDSLSYTSMHYNSGRYTIGWGSGWSYDNIATLGVYTPYTTGPAVVAESSQFGGLFIASGAATGQTIGLQGQASGSTIQGNLGVYGQAGGTMSSNIGGYFVANDGTIYPGFSGFSNLGIDVSVSSFYSTGAVGLTNSGINIYVSGRVGDNNYIGQFRDGSEGVGKVLTCVSADGLARWQTPTGGGGGTFSGGTVSGATTFQSDVTFQSNVIDENGTSVDMTNIINMTNLTLMYNT